MSDLDQHGRYLSGRIFEYVAGAARHGMQREEIMRLVEAGLSDGQRGLDAERRQLASLGLEVVETDRLNRAGDLLDEIEALCDEASVNLRDSRARDVGLHAVECDIPDVLEELRALLEGQDDE